MKTQCRVCQQPKTRVSKKSYKDGSRYYVDENGKAWTGKVCPDCRPDYYRANYRKTKNHPEKACKKCGVMFKPRRHVDVTCRACITKKQV